jgi:hypothetical protein
VICAAICIRLRQRRRAALQHSLDDEERRFQARLEAATSGVFSISGEDDELELTAHEIEQIQGLERELASKARGEAPPPEASAGGVAGGGGGGGGSSSSGGGGGGGGSDGGAGVPAGASPS